MIRNFEYFAPKTLQEALTFLDKYGDKCKVIAGGQSLLILMRQGLVAPEYLISIKGISSLNYIRSDLKEGLRIGALTPHRVVEKSAIIRVKEYSGCHPSSVRAFDSSNVNPCSFS